MGRASKICTVKLNISPPTQRAVSKMVAETATSLMPNDSVCSWICVSAWNSENSVPTTEPMMMGGSDNQSTRYSAWVK
ncbi:hypothetical protein D3C78_1646130 [compost metagenome]